MLGTKLKLIEKEERIIRQKLYEIRREKYSRSFYKSEDKSKFVDVNVCETEEGEKNKITTSGVERAITALRRKSIAVEEFNPGQVVRVCVSSKLIDKVARDENTSLSALPAIQKASRRRHSVAIVTNIAEHNTADLFTFEANYVQSVSEAEEEKKCLKDGFCLDFAPRKSQEKDADTTTDERRYSRTEKDCRYDEIGKCFTDSPLDVSKPEPEESVSSLDSNSSSYDSPERKANTLGVSNSVLLSQRPQSSRSYNGSIHEQQSDLRKCNTPVLGSSRKYLQSDNPSTPRLDAESRPTQNAFENENTPKSAIGRKQKTGSASLTTGLTSDNENSDLSEKEEKVAEQVMIRQLEIKTAADKRRRLSLQHFSDAKNTCSLKVPRRQSSGVTSPYLQRAWSESTHNDANNNTEGNQRAGIRRHKDHLQLLKITAKDTRKIDKEKAMKEQVLSKYAWDMSDCRYLRCGSQANTI
ncbi:hypothetical protein AWC38_SpisGene475 [Stylophora pistillata]|uniref:Uncharacterized protein n=1 Tax=Stylophora pistillata TaxID=50429 RepID=A0A2B4T1C9_STYPI|nr:hypothetical protein AWC38_SpisGene475 [Stylophora pistillata]